jgi:hypothetical protein
MINNRIITSMVITFFLLILVFMQYSAYVDTLSIQTIFALIISVFEWITKFIMPWLFLYWFIRAIKFWEQKQK